MNDKHLYAKFLTPSLLVEQGRLLYAALHAFSLAGYRIDLYDNLDREKLGRCGKLVPAMPGVTLTNRPPDTPRTSIYLHDQPDPACAALDWRKTIQLGTDLFSPYCRANPLIMPYGMHPRQTGAHLDETLPRLRDRPRKMRIFFSGDTKNYGRSRIRYPSRKLPRLEIIELLRACMAEAVTLVGEAASLVALRDPGSDYARRCVIMDTSRVWVEEPAWLETLADADFFLSPPGIVMPMCHNIIEALAVGTIPITNYPEWLHPNLEHMKNCIVFDSENDLLDKLKLALQLNESEIAGMRANAVAYYQEHLDPRNYVREIEMRPERAIISLAYSEGNVRDNWKMLNSNSVLMRKKPITGRKSELKCFIDWTVNYFTTSARVLVNKDFKQ